MVKLKVKNVGPIKNGSTSSDGFIDFNEVTLFVGSQGSGKSTIAKIFSTLSWIEKALVRGNLTIDYISRYKRFKKQFAYQGIEDYFNEDSIIEYIGDAFEIIYQNSNLTIKSGSDRESYLFPKIMYVPAERNFVSSVDRPDLVKRLPLPLYTFLDEYEEAKRSIGNDLALPVGNMKFEYRKQNKKSILVGSDFKVELLKASSGFQSLVPLFIVTKHLSEIIKRGHDAKYKEISVHEEEKIRKEVEQILGNAKISDDIKTVLFEKLSERFKYSSFVNVVEEPEQNLYPISQKEILFDLLSSKNSFLGNKLILTTHSPYVISYLTLSVKAGFVKDRISKNDSDQYLLDSLSKVVPIDSVIDSSVVSIYQLNDSGGVEKLSEYDGLPSDENYLNQFLAESNDLFIELMEIEDIPTAYGNSDLLNYGRFFPPQ